MLFAAIVLQAQAAVFAPPPGIPFRLVTERVQRDEKGIQTFRVERLVRFTRDGIGWRAEVRVLGVAADKSAESARLQAGYSGLAGRTLVFRLDGAGKPVSLDDQDAVWADFCAGMTQVATLRTADMDPARAAAAKRFADTLRSLPRAQQLATLAPMAEALIAPEAFDPAGAAAIRQPGASPLGGQLVLQGTRTITRGALTHTSTRTAADPAANVHIESVTERDSDPATGLLSASSETVTTRLDTLETTRTTTIRVEMRAPSDWSE